MIKKIDATMLKPTISLKDWKRLVKDYLIPGLMVSVSGKILPLEHKINTLEKRLNMLEKKVLK